MAPPILSYPTYPKHGPSHCFSLFLPGRPPLLPPHPLPRLGLQPSPPKFQVIVSMPFNTNCKRFHQIFFCMFVAIVHNMQWPTSLLLLPMLCLFLSIKRNQRRLKQTNDLQ